VAAVQSGASLSGDALQTSTVEIVWVAFLDGPRGLAGCSSLRHWRLDTTGMPLQASAGALQMSQQNTAA
jgi:hypothetical protein